MVCTPGQVGRIYHRIGTFIYWHVYCDGDPVARRVRS
jgi:hypothetical protein